MSWSQRYRQEDTAWGGLLARQMTDQGMGAGDAGHLLDVSFEWVRAQMDDVRDDAAASQSPTGAAASQYPTGAAASQSPTGAAASQSPTSASAAPDPPSGGPVKAHQGYQHEAFFYRGPQEFVAGIAPFVRGGVAMGQPVLVVVSEPRLTLLRDALGADAAGVQFEDMARLGANPARIIPRWQRFVAEFSGPDRPVRGVGEPIWKGRGPVELVECQLHEALLNIAVDADTPLWLSCPYDVDALPPEVIVESTHSHPILVGPDGYQGSTRYDGVEHVAAMIQAELPEPDARADRLTFGAADLAELRDRVTRGAVDAGIHSDRALALTVAMTEIADDSLRHGGGEGALRVWRSPDALVCEIRDHVRLDDAMVGRRAAALTERGHGVWFANQVCDLTQVRATEDGTVVRVHSWL